MRQVKVQYFTREEEEFAGILMRLGMNRHVAEVLVFFAHAPEGTSIEIERKTGLRQPEVNVALRALIKRGWVTSRKNPPQGKGRRVNVYHLKKAFAAIIRAIEEEKKAEMGDRLKLIGKIREYV
jgi:predicted transcriptional regulator